MVSPDFVTVWGDEDLVATLIDVVLTHVPTHVAGDRPGHVELRAVKRRCKEHGLLTKPRDPARRTDQEDGAQIVVSPLTTGGSAIRDSHRFSEKN